jgi:hypothetical protein
MEADRREIFLEEEINKLKIKSKELQRLLKNEK